MYQSPHKKLSQRELEVLRWVAQGKTNKEIAHEMGIVLSTVKVFKTSIKEKLGADSIPQAVAVAIHSGYVL